MRFGVNAERGEQGHDELQSKLWNAFQGGLRNVLTACAAVLYSKRVLDYSRLVAVDSSLGVGESFYRDGFQKLRSTLEGFLAAEECLFIAVMDPGVAADQLMGQLLGGEFLRILLLGDRIEHEEISAIVEMAMWTFVKIYAPPPYRARTFPRYDVNRACGGMRPTRQDCCG